MRTRVCSRVEDTCIFTYLEYLEARDTPLEAAYTSSLRRYVPGIPPRSRDPCSSSVYEALSY